MRDSDGRLLGRMANAWKPPKGHVFLTGQVGAVVHWRKVDNKEEFHGTLRRDSWETVLPELVFRPLRGEERQETPKAATKIDRPTERHANTEAALSFNEASAPSSEPKEDLAIVKKIVRESLADASDWATLLASLETNDLALAPKGGGLVVVNTKCGAHLCKLSAIGIRYLDLIREFGDGYPGHPATWLVERALTGNYTKKAKSQTHKFRSKGGFPSGDDDLTLFED